MLRGDASLAAEDLQAVIGDAASELEQLRSEKTATSLIVSKLRARIGAASTSAGGAAQDDTALLLRRFSGVSEPARSALALFYLDLFPTDQIAAVMGVELDEFASLLGRARGELNGRGFDFPNLMLNCHRPWHAAKNSRAARAVKQAQADASLKARLEEQTAFDGEQRGILGSITLPEGFEQKDGAVARPQAKKMLCDPVVMSGACGVLLILGLVIFFALQGMKRFPGHEAVFDMVDTASSDWTKVDPVKMEIGKLGDWLFMKAALENYQPAPDLAAVWTAGCRVIRQNGYPVAQIILEKPEAVLYVFKAADFGVKLKPEDDWRFFEREEWAGAVSMHGDSCTVITVRGAESDARDAVATLTGKGTR